jgi:hypothetical protein
MRRALFIIHGPVKKTFQCLFKADTKGDHENQADSNQACVEVLYIVAGHIRPEATGLAVCAIAC